jgi:alpha-tubulin suppressor-like RCC1 family protein
MINAPLNLTATAVSSSQIYLSWQDNSINKDGFEIERSTNGANYALLSTLNANTTTYSDPDLSPFVNYYYRVRAFNTIGDRSNWSNIVSASTDILLDWSQITAGESHSIVLTTAGTLWGWGNNQQGQLDPSNYAFTFTLPTLLTSDTDWSTITAGYWHTLAIKTNNTLWSWGANDDGQLGLGSTKIYDEINPVGTDSDWFMVAAGTYHTIALKTDGTLYTWGGNDDGQLGLGDVISRTTPTQIGIDSDWLVASGPNLFSIASGGRHSIALKTNRTLWAWGWNYWKQLGDSSATTRTTPRQIGTESDWHSITAGYTQSVALKTTGSLWNWGKNQVTDISPQQIGSDTDWVVISAGGADTSSVFSLALKTSQSVPITVGTLWSWGENNYGQLGLCDNDSRISLTQITDPSESWVMMTSGGYHALGLANNGNLHTWGRNDLGQLGLGDTLDRNIPCPLGSPAPPSNIMAKFISSNQITISWQDNSNNETGFRLERKISRDGTYQQVADINYNITFHDDITDTGFATDRTHYYRLSSFNTFGGSSYIENWTTMSGNWTTSLAGGYHSIGCKTDNTLWVWGSNNVGQLGLGNKGTETDKNTPTPLGTDSDWIDGALGNTYTITIKTNSTLWAWGNNEFGQLGIGGMVERTTPTQSGTDSDWAMVTAGYQHTIARKTDGTLWSCGANWDGQLGLNDYDDRDTLSQIGTESDWSVIAAGGTDLYSHTIALRNNSTLWVWGSNSFGQLGIPDLEIEISEPIQHGDDSDWSTITAKANHNLAIKTNRTLWAWGRNDDGQLGIPEVLDFQPTQVGTDSDWFKITTGEKHTIALKTNRTLWAWGSNWFGQLGLGDTVGRETPTQVEPDTDWTEITAGVSHTIARKLNRTIWTWGSNSNGQLGLGDNANRNVPTLIGE